MKMWKNYKAQFQFFRMEDIFDGFMATSGMLE